MMWHNFVMTMKLLLIVLYQPFVETENVQMLKYNLYYNLHKLV